MPILFLLLFCGTLLQDTEAYNLFSSGSDHSYGPAGTAEGIEMTIFPPKKIRYIRLWAGKSSVDDKVAILEVQPLRHPSSLASLPTGTSTASPTAGPVGNLAARPSSGSPTASPNTPPTTPTKKAKPPGTSGDPHFRTWTGEMFDFHGGCDLVLVDTPDFANGLGFSIHIRTKIKTWWSYIESAVIRIGDSTLEVQGNSQDKPMQYWIDGCDGNEIEHV